MNIDQSSLLAGIPRDLHITYGHYYWVDLHSIVSCFMPAVLDTLVFLLLTLLLALSRPIVLKKKYNIILHSKLAFSYNKGLEKLRSQTMQCMHL